MVGFDPGRKQKSLLCGVCGSLSGFMTRVFIQPLDVLKIRFQLQIEPTFKAATVGKYSGIWQAFKLVVKEEGVTAMWKGHVPAQALSVVYGYVQFTAFEHLTRAAWRLHPNSQSTNWKPVTHFVCGGFSGCFASVAAQPLDVVRTRLVAQGEPKIYTSIPQAAHKMYSLEGTKAFYRGLVPTLVQIFPYAGLQFGFYAFFKALWDMSFKVKKHEPYQAAGIGESLVCGALSGVCSKAIIYPLDMLKKRLQIQGFGEARRGFGQFQEYSGLVHCIEVIFKTEGIKGFFKGLAPSTVKASLSVALIFSTYEQCLSLFRNFVETDEVPVMNSDR